MESGHDLTEGGAKYNGIGPQASGMATCADSLAAIKQLVFDEKRCTGAELLEAVKHNWKGYEKLYALVNSSKVHHYGNDDDYADELFKFMFETYCKHIAGRKTPRRHLQPRCLLRQRQRCHGPEHQCLGGRPQGRGGHLR